MSWERFSGKAAIVTGAASGIGRAIAVRLAREGASVLLADVNAELAEETLGLIRNAGGTAEMLRVDVTRAEDHRRMVEETVSRWGGLDVLVNSAGIGRSGPIATLEEEAWDEVVDVNLKGVFLSCKAAFPALMQRNGGAIVNLASLAALAALPGMGPYAASKAGVVQLTRVLAMEGARLGIRANALCPVWIDTPMVQSYVNRQPQPEQARQGLISMIPMGRMGTVDDVTAAALFLASDEAAFITGVALPVDGGALCR